MRKAQLSLEYIFVTAVILGVAFTAFMYYKEELFFSSVEAAMKNKAEWELAKAYFDHPNCSESFLYEIYKESDSPYFANYTLRSSWGKDFGCTTTVLDSGALKEIKGYTNIVLGCRFDSTEDCGLEVIVNSDDQ